MRNLTLLDRSVTKISEETPGASNLTIDVDTGTAFVATDMEIVAFSTDSGEIIVTIPILGEDPELSSKVIDLQFVPDAQAVCAAISDGRMCLWQTDMAEELECVGEVDGGITAMAWSPDMELVVITSGLNKILLMTREFDVISEMHLYPDHEGEDANITVGWGKKETQFHGSAGKQAAKVDKVEIQPADERDHGKPQISWRGDGQFFVISVIEPSSGARYLYTWSRDCAFQAKSEPVDGLQHTVFWKPSGSLVASIQSKKHTNSQDVVFFEKNGLRHGEFTIHSLRGNHFLVTSIAWNLDSSILALIIDDLEGEENKSRPVRSTLQLWTTSNYHWYLKQNLVFEDGISTAVWDSEQAHKLHLVTRGGLYKIMTWAWTTDCTTGSSASDDCLIGVVDGAQLLLTPLRKMIVPPPMAAVTVKCSAPINSLTFDPTSDSQAVAALLSNGQLEIYRYADGENSDSVKLDAAGGDGFQAQCTIPGLEGTYRILVPNGCTMEIDHLLWISRHSLIFICLSKNQKCSTLHLGELSSESGTVSIKKSFDLESRVLGLALNEATGNVALQLLDGQLYKFSESCGEVEPWNSDSDKAVRFPYSCTEMAVTTIGREEVVLGLTERFRFFVNDVEIASNCTSFTIHNEFLLLTTLSHTLRCICRSTKVSELPKLSDGKAHPFDESIRRVERGSRIVAVVGDNTKLVFQMPRGNLETVHPRALILSSMKRLLDKKQILEAFLMMRRHRINLNLLHDHNPSSFLENIETFIQDVSEQSYLNVFLTDLIEDDVTKTMYTASYQKEAGPIRQSQVKTDSKVDRICDAFLAAFEKLGETRYIQAVLTAHVRKTRPELEEALLLVWSLHDRDDESADAALKYLLFLVDVNTLYDVALGTYNFDLVMMVAQKSQKDPKEYIPFLNQLRRLDENYRFYTIDKHLKKYPKALEHIARCGEEHFEECLTLVSDHKLHAKAIRLYQPGAAQFKRLASLYGSYLSSKNRHDEAGIMYLRAEEWESALEAFRLAHDWRQVFCMAVKLEFSPNRISELANKIAGELKERKKYADAAVILKEYAENYEDAIVCLIEGEQWEEALRLIHMHKRFDVVETHLLVALEESWEHHVDMLKSQKELFTRYRDRLLTVREMKEKARLELMDGVGDYNDADAELFSDTTSMTGASMASSRSAANSSRSTVFTKNTGSSRTRRKAENKKWSLKEGSANEEFALVDALAKIIKAVDGLKDETNSLMKMQIQFNRDEEAKNLQDIYNDFLILIQTSIPDIWIYTPGSKARATFGPNATANSIAQALQGQTMQGADEEEEKLDPVLLVPPVLNKDTRWKLHISGESDGR